MIKEKLFTMEDTKMRSKNFSVLTALLVPMVLLFSPHLFAAKVKKPELKLRKPASSEYELLVETRFAERHGNFIVQRNGDKATIEFFNNAGQTVKKNLTTENADVIAGTYLELPANNYIPAECYRNKVEIVSKGVGSDKVAKISCFGMKTKTTVAYERFVQLLTLAL